ncbi:MAG: glycosyltransferase [Hydrotalea sp.]|nr:glycosyltransferase [Hydrotalea sp.]
MDKKNSPVISVVMPVFNGARFLPAAIDSILNQTFGDIELLIDTTGSTDGATEVADDYAQGDKRIRHEKNGASRFMPQKLNHLITIASGQYIARMDGDDISLAERFAKQLAYFEQHPDVAVLGTNMMRVDEAGNLQHGFRCMQNHDEIVANTINGISGMAHPTVMMRADALKKIAGYRTQFVSAEDLDLWLRLIRAGYRFANLAEVLFHYRSHGTQATKELWRDMSLLTVLLKLNHREVSAGMPDIFDNLRPEDITIAMVKQYCHAPEEIINNYSSILFGLLSQTAHKKNNDLLRETAFCIEQMINAAANILPNDNVKKQVVDFLAKLQCEVGQLSPPFYHLFYQVYVAFPVVSKTIVTPVKERILQLMTDVGMKNEMENLQTTWRG